jgi:hypothetical protein
MRNKKIIALAVLSVFAVISIIYGVTSPPKTNYGGRPAREAAVSGNTLLPDSIISVERKMPRSDYVGWGRDPFLSKNARLKSLSRFNLNGIAWDEEKPVAVINGEVVGIGDSIIGNTIMDITPDRVVLSDGQTTTELRLPE